LMKLITGIREWVVGIALNESRSENRIKSRTYSEARQALLSQ
jgi:hypothetical protein